MAFSQAEAGQGTRQPLTLPSRRSINPTGSRHAGTNRRPALLQLRLGGHAVQPRRQRAQHVGEGLVVGKGLVPHLPQGLG